MITLFYPYTLTLKAPLLITSLEGDPNSAHSLGFIPGSAIRGAVASGLKNPAQVRQYILSGQVCYLNAYPTANSQRALPMPVSFRQEKYDASTTHDLAFYSGQPQPGEDEDQGGWPQEQLKSLEASFLSLDQADLNIASVTMESRVHQQRDRLAGRAYTIRDPQRPNVEESHGTIFTYEALEAEQEFQGIIAISGQNEEETDTLWQTIIGALGERRSLGRSRNARYGGDATITYAGSPRCYEAAGGTRLIRRNQAIQAGSPFRVFLTSDYSGRSPESGQCDPTVFKQDIVAQLSHRIEILKTRWAFRPVGGFNRKWGLQLPQTLALRAGSLLVLKAKCDIPYADLSAIEQRGLGERRTEGFGRVVFLEAPEQKCAILEGQQSDWPDEPGGPVPPLIETMQKRIITEALERHVTKTAADLIRNVDVGHIPSPSLLGRLRVPLRKGPPGLETLRDWLSENQGPRLRRPAMNQLDECRISGEKTSLSDWIRGILATNDVASASKKIPGTPGMIRKTSIQQKAAEQVMQGATLLPVIQLRLIDEVLALLARKKRSV